MGADVRRVGLVRTVAGQRVRVIVLAGRVAPGDQVGLDILQMLRLGRARARRA